MKRHSLLIISIILFVTIQDSVFCRNSNPRKPENENENEDSNSNSNGNDDGVGLTGNPCEFILDTYNYCSNNGSNNATMNLTFNSFSDAIEYVKQIHINIANCQNATNQNTNFCKCMSAANGTNITTYLGKHKWGQLFTKPKSYAIFKTLLNDTLNYLNMSGINNISINITSSHAFCRLYNWIPSYLFLYFNGSNSCLNSLTISTANTDLNYCSKKYMKFKNNNGNSKKKEYDLDKLSSGDLDKNLKCTYCSMPSYCSDSLKKLFLLETALLKPELFNDDFSSYFQTVHDVSQSITKVKRKSLFILGLNFHLYSNKKDYQQCTITDGALLIKNQFLAIYASVSNSTSSNKPFLSGIRIVITFDGNTYEFKANQTEFPDYLVLNSNTNVNSTVNDTKVNIATTGETVYIYLKPTGTHILIGGWLNGSDYYYFVFIRSISSFLSSSTGLLVDGCSKTSSKSYRFTRATDYSSDCSTASADSDNSTLFNSICVNACQQDGSNAPAQMIESSGVASKALVTTDVDTVIDSSSSSSSGNNGNKLSGNHFANFLFLTFVSLTLKILSN